MQHIENVGISLAPNARLAVGGLSDHHQPDAVPAVAD
jgi:hypothetical protein